MDAVRQALLTHSGQIPPECPFSDPLWIQERQHTGHRCALTESHYIESARINLSRSGILVHEADQRFSGRFKLFEAGADHNSRFEAGARNNRLIPQRYGARGATIQ